MKRRNFLKNSSLYGLGFLGLKSFSSCRQESVGYGPLIEDPDGILNLPSGFSYKVISQMGDKMTDGFVVPGLADGMATFDSAYGKILIIRNHELSPGDLKRGPFGPDKELLENLAPEKLYDYGRGTLPCMGGTTTLLYNPKSGQVESQWLSLAGTIRNCAGGRTPWNSWITCEENVSPPGSELEKWHGYNFEVPATAAPQLFDPVPLVSMGRFNHEAVCVDPDSGTVYQTEDRGDGLIYRFLPNQKGYLTAGGKLQVLAIKDQKGYDTRNWEPLGFDKMPIGQKLAVEWLDIDGIDAPDDDLRYRGYEKGAARFARGEGIWFGEGEFYFACTNGGSMEHGQIFRYILSPYEGTSEEGDHPATLEIFIEPNDINLVESCDNVTIASNGDLIICEDKATPRIVGVSPDGEIYHLAKNVGYQSEFAGATFSPDGQILFVNIQGPGITLAITGPWS